MFKACECRRHQTRAHRMTVFPAIQRGARFFVAFGFLAFGFSAFGFSVFGSFAA
jgi:hypothetical protein